MEGCKVSDLDIFSVIPDRESAIVEGAGSGGEGGNIVEAE